MTGGSGEDVERAERAARELIDDELVPAYGRLYRCLYLDLTFPPSEGRTTAPSGHPDRTDRA
ncbi:hypothetical protein FHX69_3246 [Prauserella muralis]|nr:hypothetical protein FHX69_3246 [Prauserella muralis]